jgi:hypothetical protein
MADGGWRWGPASGVRLRPSQGGGMWKSRFRHSAARTYSGMVTEMDECGETKSRFWGLQRLQKLNNTTV